MVESKQEIEKVPEVEVVSKAKQRARRLNRGAYWLGKNWLTVFNTFMGLLIIGPWFAPVFMQLGLETPARIIHLFYQTLCHQYPQRSYFLFGEQTMYSLEEIALVWDDVQNPFVIRQFIGTPEMGWKVAWSDRMISMYGGIWLFGVIYALPFVRYRMKPLSVIGLIICCIPMGIDGITHVISDFAGFGQGFRYHNLWLAELTNYAFSESFYAGTVIGSFNWWARLFSGLIFGLGVVWFCYPYVEESFEISNRAIKRKFDKAGLEI